MDNLLQMAWPFILMGVIFYVMIYRPQKRDQKKRTEMLDSLKVGTNIVTIGGILGTITKVQEDKVRIKVRKEWNPHPEIRRGRRDHLRLRQERHQKEGRTGSQTGGSSR